MVKLATLCYVRRDGKTLMIHRTKKKNDIHHGKWNGLGGKLEPGETPEECAIREVREEAGITARNPVLKGILTFPNFKDGEDWYVFVYVIKDFEGTVQKEGNGEGELEWIPDSKLLDLNLWEGDQYFLPLLDREGVFSGKFVYKNGRLVEHHLVVHGQS